MSYIVAIDGPAGSGKGTLTKVVAEELGLVSIDTGMLYRCHALAVVRNNIDLNDTENIIKIMDEIEINLVNENNIQTAFLNGENVTDKIRLPEVNNIVSLTSSIPEVREKVTNLERRIGYDWLKEG